MNIDLEHFKSLNPSERRKIILEMGSILDKSDSETIKVNELVLFESKSILDERGQEFIVRPGRTRGRKKKMGMCHSNSAKMIFNGYDYVEGFVLDKNTGSKISHAWNVDNNGNHYDFTFNNVEDYDYFGVVIPNKIVFDVGEKNGYIWFFVLPFIDDI